MILQELLLIRGWFGLSSWRDQKLRSSTWNQNDFENKLPRPSKQDVTSVKKHRCHLGLNPIQNAPETEPAQNRRKQIFCRLADAIQKYVAQENSYPVKIASLLHVVVAGSGDAALKGYARWQNLWKRRLVLWTQRLQTWSSGNPGNESLSVEAHLVILGPILLNSGSRN